MLNIISHLIQNTLTSATKRHLKNICALYITLLCTFSFYALQQSNYSATSVQYFHFHYSIVCVVMFLSTYLQFPSPIKRERGSERAEFSPNELAPM